MGVSDNIRRLRTDAGLTQEQLADKLGVTRATVTQWETGWSQPRMGKVSQLASLFNVPLSIIVDEGTETHPLPSGARAARGTAMGKAPRRGRVHAGTPAEPEVFDESEMVDIPQKFLDRDPGCFIVSSEGDCMNRVFVEGSDLIVSPEKQPQDKSIVLVSIDGSDAVVRRMRRTASTLILSPESYNPEHKDIIITDDSDHVVKLLGVVVWFQSAEEME